MSASVSISFEFDCINTVVKDLTHNMPEELSGAVGILLCDSLIDYQKVLALLNEKFSFPVVGGTTLTFPFSAGSEHDISASLLVFQKKSMCHAIGISKTLDESKSMDQMKETYHETLNKLDGPPKIIIPFFPLMPGVIIDKFINDLFSLADGIPVFGGIITNDLIGTKAAVFANGKAMHGQMALLMLGGDIEPVFSVGSQITCMAEYGPTVTKSDNNVVYKVDDMSFCDYLSSLGVAPEDRINGVDALLQYGPLPVLLRNKRKIDDGVAEIRCISQTNINNGSVAFSSDLPEGTKVNVGVLHKDDIQMSAQHCLDGLSAKMKKKQEKGYEFSILFCISCVARYFALVGGDNIERQLLNKALPPEMSSISYYGFSEIGPTGVDEESGKTINRSHNASIIMCAI